MLLIHHISQLLTLKGGVQRGQALGTLGIIPDGAILIEGENIKAVGLAADLMQAYPTVQRLDAGGCVVMPGLVDPHTHLVWAGDRAAEFDLRLQGKNYLEILAEGGGILSTVRATRAASLDQLVAETKPRSLAAFMHGSTTLEVKTGYGLDSATELRQLEAILRLDEQLPPDLLPTYLGAHAIAPEFKGDAEGYTQHLCQTLLPEVKTWWQQHAPQRPLPFVDVFCEKGAFNLMQTRQILETARQMGFPLKVHVDEFENLGGASLAVELGAVSADHLVKTSPQDIEKLAHADTVAVSLPCTPFGLAESAYTPAKALLQAGAALALASDVNPGTAWCESMQFVIALACRYLKLTPAQAIAAATINAAAALQMDQHIGSLEPGKQADVIILDCADYRQLGYRFGINLVTSVIKKGKVYRIHDRFSAFGC